MKNKQVNALLAATIVSTTVLAGCGGDFDPSKEYEVDVYGPAPVIEEPAEEPEIETEVNEFDPSDELMIEVYGPAPELEEIAEEEILDNEEFSPQIEDLVCVYGPPSEKSLIDKIKDWFN